MVIRLFKPRSTPLDDWIRNITNIGSAKNFKKKQSVRHFNYDEQGQLKWYWARHSQNQWLGVLVALISLDIQSEGPNILGYAEVVAKAGNGLLNADQQRTGKVILCHFKIP